MIRDRTFDFMPLIFNSLYGRAKVEAEGITLEPQEIIRFKTKRKTQVWPTHILISYMLHKTPKDNKESIPFICLLTFVTV